MEDRDQMELEARIHRELRQLPNYSAPATLAPRVMAALRAQAKSPWWQCSFWSWPAAMQGAFLFLVAAIPAFLNHWISTLSIGGSLWDTELAKVVTNGQLVMEVIVTLASALSTAARASLQPPVIAALVVAFLMYLWCLGTGTVLLRVIKH